MFLAGLTGFLDGRSEIMKTKAAEERAAKAKLTENLYGFRKQLALNSIEANFNRFNTIDKAVLEGKATLKDGFSKGKQEYMDYVKNYNPTKDFNPPNQDILNLVTVINDDFNTVYKDDQGSSQRFKSKLDGNINSSRQYLNEVAVKYAQDKNYFKNMSDNMLTQVFTSLENSVQQIRASEYKNTSEGFKSTNFYPKDQGKPFYAVTAGLEEMEKRNLFVAKPRVSATGNAINTGEEKLDINLSNKIKKETGNNVSIGETENADGSTTVNTVIVPENLTKGHEFMANLLNVNKASAYRTFKNNYYRVAGATEQKSQDVFLLSLRLGQEIPSIRNLSPDEGFLGSDDNIRNIHKILNSSGASFTDLTFAIAPYLPVPADARKIMNVQRGESRGALLGDQVEYAKTYAGGYFAGKGAKAEVKVKAFNDANKQYLREEQVGKKLEDFFIDRAKLEDQTGIANEFVASLKSKILALGEAASDVLGQGVFKDNKIDIDQSANLQIDDRDNADDSAENDKTLTAGYLENLKKRALIKATRDGKVDVIVGRLQAMRITLAFMMARAADPSGRLSNQDIEQQFVKLGGNFTTEAGALAGIKVAIDEFKDKAKVNRNIFNFVRDRRLDRGELYQLIDAAFVINNINNRVDRMGLSGTGETKDGKIDLNAKYKVGNEMLDRFVPVPGQPNIFMDLQNDIFVNEKGQRVEGS